MEVVRIHQDRCRTLVEMADACVFFYRAPEEYNEKDANKHLKPEVLPALKAIQGSLDKLHADDWDREAIHEIIKFTAERFGLKMGKVAMPVRVAIAGKGQSPSIDITLELLGRQEVLARLDKAIKWLEARG